MVTPVKAKTHPINMPETRYENEFVRASSATDPLNPGPTLNQKIDYQDKPQTGNPFVFVVLAIAVLIGGYYLYTAEWPSTTTTSTITQTDMAPAANAPATSTTVAPAAPMAATPPATDTPAAPLAVAPPAPATTDVPATPPAAGTTPAPATKTTP